MQTVKTATARSLLKTKPPAPIKKRGRQNSVLKDQVKHLPQLREKAKAIKKYLSPSNESLHPA